MAMDKGQWVMEDDGENDKRPLQLDYLNSQAPLTQVTPACFVFNLVQMRSTNYGTFKTWYWGESWGDVHFLTFSLQFSPVSLYPNPTNTRDTKLRICYSKLLVQTWWMREKQVSPFVQRHRYLSL